MISAGIMTSKISSPQASWQQGQDEKLQQMEDALDALSTFQLDLAQRIVYETDFILGFLRNFPAESVNRVMLPLFLRLSGRPLPSGRTREQLLETLGPQVWALSSSFSHSRSRPVLVVPSQPD